MNIASPLNDPRTPSQKQADLLRAMVAAQAQQALASYRQMMQIVYQNRTPGVTKESLVACLSQEEAIALRQLACIRKAEINRLAPGTINDIVPEAAIILPQNLFPEVVQ